MLSIGWSPHAVRDLPRIESYWLRKNPDMIPLVLHTILARVTWAADHPALGSRVRGLSSNYRWQLDRDYGYKIYYRINGEPPTGITVITIRHGLQKPLRVGSINRYGTGS